MERLLQSSNTRCSLFHERQNWLWIGVAHFWGCFIRVQHQSEANAEEKKLLTNPLQFECPKGRWWKSEKIGVIM